MKWKQHTKEGCKIESRVREAKAYEPNLGPNERNVKPQLTKPHGSPFPSPMSRATEPSRL